MDAAIPGAIGLITLDVGLTHCSTQAAETINLLTMAAGLSQNNLSSTWDTNSNNNKVYVLYARGGGSKQLCLLVMTAFLSVAPQTYAQKSSN